MRKTDQNIFRRIFQDHWEGFKEKFPCYDTENYNKNVEKMLGCGYSCLEDVVSYVLKQKIKIGAIIVVQTHGRSGKYNPHLHIIMTSGGIDEKTGSWCELGYFPYKIIHKKWQYYLLKMLREFDRSVEMGAHPLIL